MESALQRHCRSPVRLIGQTSEIMDVTVGREAASLHRPIRKPVRSGIRYLGQLHCKPFEFSKSSVHFEFPPSANNGWMSEAEVVMNVQHTTPWLRHHLNLWGLQWEPEIAVLSKDISN